MSMKSWKKELLRVCGECCVICGEPVPAGERSYDHFVPQAFSGPHNHGFRVGLVFLAHQTCNNERGHQYPSEAMLERAAEIIADMPDHRIVVATENVDRLVTDHQAFLETLRGLKTKIARNVAERRERLRI